MSSIFTGYKTKTKHTIEKVEDTNMPGEKITKNNHKQITLLGIGKCMYCEDVYYVGLRKRKSV